MASMKKRASGARLQHSAGNVSHDAEQRVHKRVIEIMARRAAAEVEDPVEIKRRPNASRVQ